MRKRSPFWNSARRLIVGPSSSGNDGKAPPSSPSGPFAVAVGVIRAGGRGALKALQWLRSRDYRWFRDLPMAQKLALVIGAMFVSTLAVGVVGLQNTVASQERVATLVDGRLAAVTLLVEMRSEFFQASSQIGTIVASRSVNDVARAAEGLERSSQIVERNFQRYRQLPDARFDERQMIELETLLALWLP
ncbi:MAG: MCP four helix bundle domain-containing protein, partial [Dehalococcoidia bacterium]|nr:MCP four helix bundle domain-containing protein [Dehalococcoidia bacterium]